MTRIDLTALRTLAEAAAPGPWAIEPHPFGNSPARSIHVADRDADEFPVVEQLGCGCCDVGLDADAEDLAYIAAANPATVLRLLDALEDVRALHSPADIYPLADECECGNEDHVIIDSFQGEELCWLSPTGDRYCSECVDETGDELPAYPCPTITAIEAALGGGDDD